METDIIRKPESNVYRTHAEIMQEFKDNIKFEDALLEMKALKNLVNNPDFYPQEPNSFLDNTQEYNAKLDLPIAVKLTRATP